MRRQTGREKIAVRPGCCEPLRDVFWTKSSEISCCSVLKKKIALNLDTLCGVFPHVFRIIDGQRELPFGREDSTNSL